MQRPHYAFRLAFLVIGLMTLLGLAGPAVAAQDQEITFRISAYACDRDPGNVSPVADNIPDYCDALAGVTYDVALVNGTAIGSCTTDATGICSLQVPNEEDVTVTQDASTVPAGAVARENPITTTAVTEFAGAVFIYVPEATGLPDTGSGASEAPADHAMMIAMAGTVLCASSAILIRRRLT